MLQIQNEVWVFLQPKSCLLVDKKETSIRFRITLLTQPKQFNKLLTLKSNQLKRYKKKLNKHKRSFFQYIAKIVDRFLYRWMWIFDIWSGF